MKFHSLVIQNFGTIGNATIHLDGRGLNLIQGSNDDSASADSNGAGKSTLVEALCWVNYGITARGIKGDAVVNRKRKKDCFVASTMSNGATQYRVTRYRKHKDGKNALKIEANTGAEWVDLSKGTDAETQKELETILGCSPEVFMASVYCGQEAMPNLPAMKDRELKQLIEEAAGLQRIEQAYEIARGKALDSRRAFDATGTRLDTALGARERAKVQLTAATNARDEWEAGRAERVEAAEAKVAAQRTKLLELATTARDCRTEADQATAEIVTLDTQLAEHSTRLTESRAADRAQSQADMALQNAKTALQNCANRIAETCAALAEPAKHIAKTCSSCGVSSATMTIEDFIAHRQAHLDKERAAQTDLANAARAALQKMNEAKNAAVEALARVPDVSAVNARKTALQAAVTRFSTAMNAVNTARTVNEGLVADVEKAKTERNPEQSAVDMATETLAACEKNLVELTAERDKLAARASVDEAVVKVFGPAGVRAQILDTVTPYLNDRTADYLSILSDGGITATWSTLTRGASGDLKEKFSIEVEAPGTDSFAGLSGGEKRKVRLAAALALQDMVATRATQPIDLFIGDEIDDALDVSGLERLMTILERKARERGTVLVISHSDLTAWIDEVTVVKKAGEVSIVEGSLCE